MRFLSLLLAAGTASLALAALVGEKKKRVSKLKFFSVNESGLEFGITSLPGTNGKDYVWPTLSTIDTSVSKCFNAFRVNIMMEHIVPNSMTGSLDSAYLAGLTTTVNCITNKSAYAIIVPHNYGRSHSNIITDTSGFQSLWKTLAGAFYKQQQDRDIDQSLVVNLNGIHAAGATSQYTAIEGNDWTGAWTWASGKNGAIMGALTDPQNIIHQMHQYLDSDGSGTSATSVSNIIGQGRIQAVTQWLKNNGKLRIIGESAGGANSQCKTAVQGILSCIDSTQTYGLALCGGLLGHGGPTTSIAGLPTTCT